SAAAVRRKGPGETSAYLPGKLAGLLDLHHRKHPSLGGQRISAPSEGLLLFEQRSSGSQPLFTRSDLRQCHRSLLHNAATPAPHRYRLDRPQGFIAHDHLVTPSTPHQRRPLSQLTDAELAVW